MRKMEIFAEKRKHKICLFGKTGPLPYACFVMRRHFVL
ncbi:hypothetical protein CHCC20335_4463 [Bacillus paralicheniformis]|nr:hypothetical protein CHCC20335_4463 [Bacillus paralicheniformis]